MHIRMWSISLFENLKRLKKITKDPILPLSCETAEGLEELKKAIAPENPA